MQLNSVIDHLKPHILFARKEIELRSWDSSIENKLKNLFKGLSERVNDPCINISVTGEFSSGKSSVINAILGMNLLATDEMPDTTLVPAIISYYSRPMIEIIYTDGHQVRKEMCINEIQNFLSGKSVVRNIGESEEDFIKRLFEVRSKAEKKASEIRQFNIGVPSEFLHAGFRIIDTPGLNSGNRRCADVTKRLLTQTDASIIVGNATGGGLKDVLRDDFKELLQHKLMHCMVVYTHYDKATRREKLARYLAGVTASYFDLTPDKLPVLMMVPPTIEASIQGKRIGDDFDEMLAVTTHSIRLISEYAQQQRLLIIFQQLQHLTDELFASLSQIIENQKSIGTERLTALKRSRTAPIDKFINGIVPIIKGQMVSELTLAKKSLTDSLNIVTSETKGLLSSRMRHQQNLDKFKEYVNSELSNDISNGIKRMKSLQEGASKNVSEIVEKFNKRFEHNLRNEFTRLNIMVDGIDLGNMKIALPEVSFTGSVNEAVSIVGKELDHEDATFGGAIIGAIIGSIFTFGIGTGIGAAIGGLLFGRGKSASVENAYNKLWPDFAKNFDEGYQAYMLQVADSFSSWCDSIVSDVENHYYSYIGRYEKSVDRMIAMEQKKVNEVVAQIHEYQERLIEISKHKQEIDNIWETQFPIS